MSVPPYQCIRVLILVLICSTALQNHRPIFSSLSFSLSTRLSRSSPPLPSSSARSLRWMTLSLRGRERGKILNSERFRAIEPILLIGRRRWWWWHERGSLALQIAHGLQPAGASWQNIIHLSEHHCAASSEQFGTGQNIESTSDRRVSPLQPGIGRGRRVIGIAEKRIAIPGLFRPLSTASIHSSTSREG